MIDVNFKSNLGEKLWLPPPPTVIAEFTAHERSTSGINAYLISDIESTVTEKKAGIYIAAIKKRLRFCRDTNTGFSLVRMGDGEGNVLSSRRLNLYPALLNYTLEKISHLHFGSLDVVPQHKFKIANLISDAAASADFVGMPDNEALRRHYKKPDDELDIRACMGLFYANTASSFINTDKQVNWWIARSLLPHFDEIISNYRNVVLITNHSKLESHAIDRFKLESCTTIQIPNQAKNQKYKHLNTHFYPNTYLTTLNNIPHQKGALYLVGAGLLGKSICSYIKRFKGHAIDVGSIFDIWAGLITRPGVEEELVTKYSWRKP